MQLEPFLMICKRILKPFFYLKCFILFLLPPTAISCGDPGTPPFALMSGQKFTNRAVVHYSCSQGRTLVGNATRQCLEDGRWSGSPPYCSGTHIGRWQSLRARDCRPASQLIFKPLSQQLSLLQT